MKTLTNDTFCYMPEKFSDILLLDKLDRQFRPNGAMSQLNNSRLYVRFNSEFDVHPVFDLKPLDAHIRFAL